MKKDKINVGDMCIFDPINRLNRKVGESVDVVQIVDIRKSLLLPTIYYCVCLKTGRRIMSPKHLLVKLNNDMDYIISNTVIRHPDDAPDIDYKDYDKLIEVLDKLPEQEKDKVSNVLHKLKAYCSVEYIDWLNRHSQQDEVFKNFYDIWKEQHSDDEEDYDEDYYEDEEE